MNTDVHDLAGAYAVDALPDEERRFFERHLTDCVDCRGEVGELQVTAAVLGTAAFSEPPPGMRDRVLAAVATTPQEAPAHERFAERAPSPTGAGSSGAPVARGPRERLRQLLPAVAAVIALGVAGVTVVASQTGGDPAPGAQLAELVAAPDARLVDLSAPEGATARFVWSQQRGRGVFIGDGLEAPPQGHAYALWVIEAETPPVLVGMFQPDGDGRVRHAVGTPLPGAATVAVTVEVEDGVDAPTTDPVIVGEL